jgi:hypothetical protein
MISGVGEVDVAKDHLTERLMLMMCRVVKLWE